MTNTLDKETIEKLAKETGFQQNGSGQIVLRLPNGNYIAVGEWLQAFAQAVIEHVGGEPAFWLSHDWKKGGELDWCTNEYKTGDCDNFKHRYTVPVYLHPPALEAECEELKKALKKASELLLQSAEPYDKACALINDALNEYL